jgi:hypothetical protein
MYEFVLLHFTPLVKVTGFVLHDLLLLSPSFAILENSRCRCRRQAPWQVVEAKALL